MERRTRNLMIAAAVAILAVLVGGRLAAEFAVDLLWFQSVGYSDVFWTRWTIGILVRLVVGLVAGAFVFLNLWIVSRTLGTIRVRRRFGNIEIAERLPRVYVLGTLIGLSFFSALWLSGGVGDPIAVYAALRAESWGMVDPVHGRDVSFYVFQYPVLNRLQLLAGVVVFWTMLLAGIAYVATGSARWTDAGPSVTPGARRHLGLLAAGLLLVFAFGLWLDRYDLLMTGQGVGGALGYTDVHARIPARILLTGLAVIAAAAVAHGAWHGSLRPPLFAIGLLILGFVGGQLVYPAALQNLRVEPDEFARESPYIEHNLAFTRHAYGLSALRREAMPFRGGTTVSPDAVAERLEGVPLWDSRPLLQTFRALQAPFRPYFDFVSVHYDRYGPPGEAQQVAIAVRELDVNRLPSVAQTWQNLRLNYVRGEGAVVSPVAQMAAGGEPRYFVSDLDPLRIAPDAPEGLEIAEPGVYFAEMTRGHVILNTTMRAETQPLAPGSPQPIGVELTSWWRKLAFAWAFQSRNLLLSGELTPQSRVVYRRLVRERAEAVAPFLQYSAGELGGPYPVIFEGRIVWILDAYTSSTHFPLAPAVRFGDRGVRYVRNSVKVTIDGVSGEVRLFVVDEDDPILRTYARIFPDLFQPISEMPPGLRRHLRFPAALFGLQASVLQEYHLRDARAFYNRDDVWQIPTETYRDRAVVYQPYYAMLPLPGEEATEFLISMPFVAAGRQNMTSMLVTRNDPPHYGEQILFDLPRDELIPGPQQVESLIDQDPAISEQLALWKRGGSDVIRGHIVIVPVDSTLIYVEPLFLEAQESAIPQLERVIVAAGRRVVMRPTMQGALAALFEGEGVTDERRAGALAAAPTSPAQPTPAPGATPAAGTPGADVERVRRLMEQADAHLRAGDLAAFGQTWAELRAALRAAPGNGLQ
jgi:uncharacterized protein